MKTSRFVVLSLWLGTVLPACQPRLDPLLNPTDARVQVGYADSLARYPLPVGGLLVTLRSADDPALTRSARTDARGIAAFPALEASAYDISADTTLSATDYQQATGRPVAGAIRFSGTLRRQVFRPDVLIDLKLRVRP